MKFIILSLALIALLLAACDCKRLRKQTKKRSKAVLSAILYEDEKLNMGDRLESTNKIYFLTMQDDGNLVVYFDHMADCLDAGINFVYERPDSCAYPPKALWASGTNGKGTSPYRMVMQKDGNLVIYDAHNNPTWASNTYKKGSGSPYILGMQNDGNLVIYDGKDNAIWASNTQERFGDIDVLPERGRAARDAGYKKVCVDRKNGVCIAYMGCKFTDNMDGKHQYAPTSDCQLYATADGLYDQPQRLPRQNASQRYIIQYPINVFCIGWALPFKERKHIAIVIGKQSTLVCMLGG
eukprot:TRINITY_DN88324_c0_g1_i1.p1 TRINITY_DN88324_c0_g1~~TRINITY_DN88324_c0_g1_i1.p1  ORF type:complete len:331 (-),score=-3.12 TRINITY_DN88324_c0_g1_i1:127-1011(-)